MKVSTFAFLLASMAAAPASAATALAGFTFEVIGGGAFETVTAPTFATVPDPDGYDVTVGGSTVPIASGQTLDFFSVFGVTPTLFTISDIDPELGLDPSDPFAFPSGVSITDYTSGGTLNITPITVNTSAVPLPTSILFLGAGLLAFATMRRSRSPVSA